jgi:translation initiation factor 3 subunit B
MIKDIKKNLKKYSVEFDNIDRIRGNKKSSEVLQKRREKFEEFQTLRNQKIAQYEAERAERIALRGGVDTEAIDVESQEMEEEVVEFLVKEEETVVE